MKYFQNIFKDDKFLLLKKHIAIEEFSLSLAFVQVNSAPKKATT